MKISHRKLAPLHCITHWMPSNNIFLRKLHMWFLLSSTEYLSHRSLKFWNIINCYHFLIIWTQKCANFTFFILEMVHIPTKTFSPKHENVDLASSCNVYEDSLVTEFWVIFKFEVLLFDNSNGVCQTLCCWHNWSTQFWKLINHSLLCLKQNYWFC